MGSENLGLGLFWTILTAIPVLISIGAYIYWIKESRQYRTKFSKYMKTLICLNWTGITFFTVSNVFILAEYIRSVALNRDFTKFLEDDMQVLLYGPAIFYMSGKWLVYFILYMHLKLTLKKSAYNYSDATYSRLKAAIWLEIVCSLLMTVLFISFDYGVGYYAALCAGLTFLLLDIFVPVCLNVLFLQRTYQIGKNYYHLISMPKSSSATPPHTDAVANENERSLQELFAAITNVAIMAFFIAISSFLFLIIMACRPASRLFEVFIMTTVAIDGATNSICLILTFEFARPLYNKVCNRCRNCAFGYIQKRSMQSQQTQQQQ